MKAYDVFTEFSKLFPDWMDKVESYKKTGSKTISIKIKNGKSFIFLYDGESKNWSFGNYGWRRNKRKRKKEKLPVYRNIFVPSHIEACKIVDSIIERIDKYGAASVADLLDLINQPTTSRDDCDYGWTSYTTEFKIKEVKRGYLIKVSEPKYLHPSEEDQHQKDLEKSQRGLS